MWKIVYKKQTHFVFVLIRTNQKNIWSYTWECKYSYGLRDFLFVKNKSETVKYKHHV